MRIRTTIQLALGTVLILHIFTAVMGHAGLEKSQNDLAIYEGVNSDTLRVLAIDKGIAELQRSVSTYMLNGHKSSAERVRDLLKHVRNEIRFANDQTEQAEVREQLDAMNLLISSFESNFEKVVVDREARERLVHEEMFPTKQLIIQIIDNSSPASSAILVPVQRHVYLAENSALKYFENPSRAMVDEAIYQIQSAEELIESSGSSSEEPLAVYRYLLQYERTFLRAVQATQGYMHLVHVVLAGETSELLYQSAQIRSGSLERRDAIKVAMAAGAKRFQAWSDMVAVLTVLAGLLTAGLMTRSVLVPILNLTHTFHQLAEGKNDAEIEYSDRSNEIGMMAKAAEVFRLKNHETEELLEHSQSMASDLERRNSEMTQFVYTVSHDLKSPLVTMHGFAGALKSAIADGDLANAEGMVDRIHSASLRMSQTVEDLLELSRIGMVVNEPVEFKFGDACDAVVQDLSGLRLKTDAKIQVSGKDSMVFGDELRIRQVLQNLIQNAMVYGRRDGNPPEIDISLEQADGQSVIRVADHGHGIDKAFQEKVFGIFQRLSTETQGTGVGLAIVRKIAVAHGGKAWVESRDGEGAAFYVSIPQKIATADTNGVNHSGEAA